MKQFTSIFTAALFGSFTLVSAQGSTTLPADASGIAPKPQVAQNQTNETPTIVEVASNNEVFSTLVAAVGAADLVETLNGAGPFTVFAPTNDAFDRLPEGTLESLLKPVNKQTLTKILTYHVVAGKFMAEDVVKAIKANNNDFTVKTVQGSILRASIQDGNVILTDTDGNISKVTATDVKASNGVIHVIDNVVMPK